MLPDQGRGRPSNRRHGAGRTLLSKAQIPAFTGGPSVPGALIHASRDGTNRGLVAVDVNVPILWDGVAVRPGDIILGDMDGVIVIPIEIADKVAERGQAHEKLEELARKLAFDGKPIEDLYAAGQMDKGVRLHEVAGDNNQV